MKPGDLVRFALFDSKVGIVTQISTEFALVRWGNGVLRWENIRALKFAHKPA